MAKVLGASELRNLRWRIKSRWERRVICKACKDLDEAQTIVDQEADSITTVRIKSRYAHCSFWWMSSDLIKDTEWTYMAI